MRRTRSDEDEPAHSQFSLPMFDDDTAPPPPGAPAGSHDAAAAPAAARVASPHRLFRHLRSNREVRLGAHLIGYELKRGRRRTIGFAIGSPEQVDAWHRAGVENGGTSCEDPPGLRAAAFGNMYLAYLRDPAGNKLCGFHMVAG